MPPLHSGEFFICIHDLDPGVKPQDDRCVGLCRHPDEGRGPLCKRVFFVDFIYLDPGVKPKDDTTSLKLRGAGTTSLKLRGAGITVLCFLFLGTVCHPCKGRDRGRTGAKTELSRFDKDCKLIEN